MLGFYRKCKKHITIAGLTRTKVAVAAGLSRATVDLIVRSEKPCHDTSIRKIIDALNTLYYSRTGLPIDFLQEFSPLMNQGDVPVGRRRHRGDFRQIGPREAGKGPELPVSTRDAIARNIGWASLAAGLAAAASVARNLIGSAKDTLDIRNHLREQARQAKKPKAEVSSTSDDL